MYKKSFGAGEVCNFANCRPNPIRPYNLLRTNTGKFASDTVTSLSFPPHCASMRVQPIRPRPQTLIGCGPIQEVTTQRHDYCCKQQPKRTPIIPPCKLCIPRQEPFAKETVNKLSFPVPNYHCYEPALSCKPVTKYHRSDGKFFSNLKWLIQKKQKINK